ncbi:hypothetical protein [Corallococcus sp. EGB]|uniref:hypothetical protein n=1 Tax=Corallococcus sp. EGB TaxID=1521117 RepID=UPI001CBB61FC|nr:hypothetical protein [Corallococcus sp. EGB]
MEKLSEDSLVQRLGCTPDVLQWLSLCLTPDGPDFEEQTRGIADRFEVDLQKLVHVLRRVQVQQALAKPTVIQGSPIDIAARDREDEEEEDLFEDEFEP